MLLELGAHGRLERVVHVAGDELGVAGHGRLPTRASRNCARPRWIRDITVPTGTLEDARDVLVAELLEVAQHDGRTEGLGEALERPREILAALGHEGLRRLHGRPVLGQLVEAG